MPPSRNVNRNDNTTRSAGTCPVCGTAFTPIRRQRYCTPACRQAACRTRHPNPAIGEPPMVLRARALAAERGLAGRHVFFRDWTPYAERGACLLDAELDAVAADAHHGALDDRAPQGGQLLSTHLAGGHG